MINRISGILILSLVVVTANGVFAEEDKSLKLQLSEKKAAYRANAPQARLDLFDAATQNLAESGILETALNKGDKAPDFTLKDPLGRNVTLSKMLQEGPVILTWYRGSWCPYCNLQLRDYQKRLDQIKAAGGQLVAISPEIPDNALTLEQKNQLEFKVVSDLGNKVAKSFGIVYQIPESLEPIYGPGGLDLAKYNGDDSLELPLAVTYIVDQDGTIGYAFVSADYTERAETTEVIAALNAM